MNRFIVVGDEIYYGGEVVGRLTVAEGAMRDDVIERLQEAHLRDECPLHSGE